MGNRRLYIALDSENQRKNIENAQYLAKNVQGDYGFKLNLDSVADFSSQALNPYSLVRVIQETNKPVFVDMKMWNGGRTMGKIAKQCAIFLGVDIINMWPHAGEKFYKRVLSELEGSNTRLFGLTVLTHYTDADTQRLYGKSLKDAVRMFAEMNVEYGAHGIIVPGTTLDVVKDLNVTKLVPAVRPVWYEDKKANEQEQTVTPEEAFENGAEIVVCGSPIFKSEDPLKSLERILSDISK